MPPQFGVKSENDGFWCLVMLPEEVDPFVMRRVLDEGPVYFSGDGSAQTLVGQSSRSG
jgi:hypothetical protein